MASNAWRPRKRLSTDEPNGSFNQYESRTENVSSQRLRQLESKNEELEARINSIEMNFQTQIKNLRQQYEQIICRLQLHQHRIETEQTNHSVEVESDSPNINQLRKEFEERCDLAESNNQTVTERVDSCEQKFLKMNSKTENFEHQLTSLERRLNNLEMDDTNMQCTTITDVQSTVENGGKEMHDTNYSFDLVEKALCQPYESELKLSTDEIKYGVYGICDKYNVILVKEKDQLKLFDYQEQIDICPYGTLSSNNYGTCIHWCEFLDQFLVLYRFGLYMLPLKRDPETSKMALGDLKHVTSIRAYPSTHGDNSQSKKPRYEILRFITTSHKLPGYMYLNRDYRRIELINTNSWKLQRGWSKNDLDYDTLDNIKSITLSQDGTYLAMNIYWNERTNFVDLRKHDQQMTLLKRIRMQKDSVSLSHKAQILFGSDVWFLVDEKNQCYIASANPNNERIIPIRTDEIRAIENVPIRLSLIDNNYLCVGAAIGNCLKSQGVLRFYKIPF